MEHTKDFTVKNRKTLWQEFAAAFDSQKILDENGKVISVPTNISGSKSSVWLHLESDSGIPHLHAVVCRIDGNGNINNDCAIHYIRLLASSLSSLRSPFTRLTWAKRCWLRM